MAAEAKLGGHELHQGHGPMADREQRNSRAARGRGKRLEEILERATQQLRQVLERLESELVEKGLTSSLGDAPDAPDALVCRFVFSASATYVVTRLATDVLKGLSPRQLEIAELVLLQRITQKEAARRLGISPRTLTTHLGRVYQKCREVSRDRLLRHLSLLS